MHWIDRYLAVPFVDGGRSFAGADCYGLYALAVAGEAGVDVPMFSGVTTLAEKIEAINGAIAAGLWRKIDGEPKRVAQKLDAIWMIGRLTFPDGTLRRAACHIGFATGTGKVLHTESSTGHPRCVRLDDPAIVHRVLGVYRPTFLETQAIAAA